MVLQPFMNGRLGVVANVPGAVGEGSGGEVFHHRVEDDAVAAYRDQISVSIQLGEHVLVRVVGIQRHQHTIETIRMATRLLDDVSHSR